MNDYNAFPMAALLDRWNALPEDLRPLAWGYCSSALEQAQAAVGVAEMVAAKNAADKAARRRPKLRTIQGGRHD